MRLLAPLSCLLAALLVFASSAGAAGPDRDHDRLPDRWERQHGLPTTQAGANGDPDRDGVDNRNEFREASDPRRHDSDRDGRDDGREDADADGLANAAEDASGNDPINADSDGDGVRDGRERAGTVAAFSDGVLQIRLAGGGTVTGSVDELTDVSCKTEARLEQGQRGGTLRGLRIGRRHTGHNGKGKRSTRHARATQLGDDEEGGDDPEGDDDPSADDSPVGDEEDSVDEEDGSVDDGASDEDGDDESDDDGWDDESWDDDSSNGGGACLAKRLRRGAHVHQAELSDSSFLAVELMR